MEAITFQSGYRNRTAANILDIDTNNIFRIETGSIGQCIHRNRQFLRFARSVHLIRQTVNIYIFTISISICRILAEQVNFDFGFRCQRVLVYQGHQEVCIPQIPFLHRCRSSIIGIVGTFETFHPIFYIEQCTSRTIPQFTDPEFTAVSGNTVVGPRGSSRFAIERAITVGMRSRYHDILH